MLSGRVGGMEGRRLLGLRSRVCKVQEKSQDGCLLEDVWC